MQWLQRKNSNNVSVRLFLLKPFARSQRSIHGKNSKHKSLVFSKEFKLKVVKYYHDNMKNNNKTAIHFHVDRKQVSAFLSHTILL